MALESARQQAPGAALTLGAPVYDLVLFINGATTSSARAIRQVHALCEEHLPNHSLTVVDVQREPDRLPDRVLAVPTLLREGEASARMVVGDFSDARRVLDALGIPTAHSSLTSLPDG